MLPIKFVKVFVSSDAATVCRVVWTRFASKMSAWLLASASLIRPAMKMVSVSTQKSSAVRRVNRVLRVIAEMVCVSAAVTLGIALALRSVILRVLVCCLVKLIKNVRLVRVTSIQAYACRVQGVRMMETASPKFARWGVAWRGAWNQQIVNLEKSVTLIQDAVLSMVTA